MGFTTKEVIQILLGKLYGIPYVGKSKLENIPREVIDIISGKVASKYSAIPMAKEDHTLTVAFANPSNVNAIDDLQFMTGCRIKVVMAVETEIKDALQQYYSENGSIDNAFGWWEAGD